MDYLIHFLLGKPCSVVPDCCEGIVKYDLTVMLAYRPLKIPFDPKNWPEICRIAVLPETTQ
jgi:hypothetical protein